MLYLYVRSFFSSTFMSSSLKSASAMPSKADLELCKKYAALKAVEDRTLQDNMVIGIGSGSTIVHVVKRVAEIVNSRKPQLDITFIPSSFQAEQLILGSNLKLGSLNSHPTVDWTIDGADEIDDKNNVIKGGGGCLTQEKMLAASSKEFYIAADYSKYSSQLGEKWKGGIPVEVIPSGYVAVKGKIEHCFGGDAVLRMAVMKMGPLVTDNGNFILDWKYPTDQEHVWSSVSDSIKLIPGVVEVGLFINMASVAYIGNLDGKVNVLKF